MTRKPTRPPIRHATHESPVRSVVPSLDAVGRELGRCTRCDETVPQGEHLVIRCAPGESEISERCDGPYLTGLASV